MHAEKIYGWPTRVAGDAGRVALLLPGRGYVAARPLLHYARAVLARRGWTTQELWWEPPADLGPSWVLEQVERALDREGGGRVLLVGKSLASLAAPLAAERELPAIWLTPLLHIPAVAEAVEHTSAPTLLVGGTADPSWKPDTITRSRAERLELPGADHGLEVADPVDSAEILKRVTMAMDGFVAGLR